MIGFSIFSAAILLFAYLFFLQDMQKSLAGRVSCALLLAALTGLQWQHLQFLQTGQALFESRSYLLLLLMAPPAFYFFSREILLPGRRKSLLMLVHFVPLLASYYVPAAIIAPLAFLVGAGYAIWLARVAYGMREQSHRFRFEKFFFAFFALLAVLVLALGAAIPVIDPAIFYIAYANFTGIAFVLIVAALIIFPELLSDISDAATVTYANSTLRDVDIDDALRRLDILMTQEKIYQNENLNLGLLAEATGLNSHQLSELINTQFGHGFSRYVREQRVAEARRLLVEDPQASILSISLATGFRSQSNFYAAFKEITGQAPGVYRESTRDGSDGS